MELSIDTSTRYASVGLSQEGKILAEYSWVSRQNHSVELLPAAEHLLKTTSISLEDVDCIILATGPGGFSALRVGMSTAKGLGVSLGIPLVAINTLDIEAYPYRGLGLPVCSILDVGRGEMAAAAFTGDKDSWIKTNEDRIVTSDDLCSSIMETTLFCGEGISVYSAVLQGGLGDKAVIAEQSLPTRKPGALSQMGYLRFELGEVDDIYALEPLYLRSPSITLPRSPS